MAANGAPVGKDSSALLTEKLARALERLESARPFAKVTHQGPVLDLARRLLQHPDGIAPLAALAPRFDAAGVFLGTDWEAPRTLLPQLVSDTFVKGDPATVVLEVLSELRLLAIAQGEAQHEGLTAEHARRYLTQVLALNLNRVFGTAGEADRERLGAIGEGVTRQLRHLLDEIGFEDVLDSLIAEIWRILAQRPVQVGHVKAMLTQIAVTLADGVGDIGETRPEADRLISALFGPTQGCGDDPGVDVYAARLATMDPHSLMEEASGFARTMHATGLVSDYHAIFLRRMVGTDRRELLADALGLSPTGRDSLRRFPDLVDRLIEDAIHPATTQAVYGLALLLERGLLYAAPVAAGLWRQIHLALSPQSAETLTALFGAAIPARVHLLAGVIELLGQPLGIGQGSNPTCQSARALSMWSLNEPAYLLHLVAQMARTETVSMQFEGLELRSHELPVGMLPFHPLDNDPVSTLLIPHLDRIYAAMGRLCAGRLEDPHRWVNREFHGWWVGSEFAIAVDVASGMLADYDAFIRDFYDYYHPYFNGMTSVIHPQPAGLAITDSTGTFIGWHAITLLRVALDPREVMRVYFYNPNNDSGQNWGQGVVVSTSGHGERAGEGSLPFAELASRLYIFHYDTAVSAPRGDVPAADVESVKAMARASWAATRLPA